MAKEQVSHMIRIDDASSRPTYSDHNTCWACSPGRHSSFWSATPSSSH